MAAFARGVIQVSRADLDEAGLRTGLWFFDRGLVDGAVGLEDAGGPLCQETLGGARPYWREVFLVPP